MEEAFKKWSATIGSGSMLSSMTIGTLGGHTHSGTTTIYTPPSPVEFISMSMTLDYDENLEPKVEAKPEPVKAAKPIKRYSKREFKNKLKELCG